MIIHGFMNFSPWTILQKLINYFWVILCIDIGMLIYNFENKSDSWKTTLDIFKNHLNRLYIDEKIFKEMITRPSKVVRYRNERWGDHVKSLYLKNKEAYDRITYKRVQSNNMNLMQEVYFRLKDKEETWESILSQFPASQGKNGILKDVPAENIEEKLLLQMKNAGKENVTFLLPTPTSTRAPNTSQRSR